MYPSYFYYNLGNWMIETLPLLPWRSYLVSTTGQHATQQHLHVSWCCAPAWFSCQEHERPIGPMKASSLWCKFNFLSTSPLTWAYIKECTIIVGSMWSSKQAASMYAPTSTISTSESPLTCNHSSKCPASFDSEKALGRSKALKDAPIPPTSWACDFGKVSPARIGHINLCDMSALSISPSASCHVGQNHQHRLHNGWKVKMQLTAGRSPIDAPTSTITWSMSPSTLWTPNVEWPLTKNVAPSSNRSPIHGPTSTIIPSACPLSSQGPRSSDNIKLWAVGNLVN